MAPTAASMARAAAAPSRLGKASVATPAAVGQIPGFAQVNAAGLPFWQLGSPQCKDSDVRVYPDVED